MKERPIIMDAESVRAILDGRKTQTRRVFKSKPSREWGQHHYGEIHKMDKNGNFPMKNGGPIVIGWGAFNTDGDEGYVCPYGKPGDRLWVRETWYCDNPATARDAMAYGTESVFYKATEADPGIFPTWKSPLFMPRWASRLTLEIVDARAEELLDITADDAVAEGMYDDGIARHCRWGYEGHLTYVSGGDEHGLKCHTCGSSREHPIKAYLARWDSINAKRGYPSKDNPLLWAITFKRLP